jgi:hypothetical protein
LFEIAALSRRETVKTMQQIHKGDRVCQALLTEFV